MTILSQSKGTVLKGTLNRVSILNIKFARGSLVFKHDDRAFTEAILQHKSRYAVQNSLEFL